MDEVRVVLVTAPDMETGLKIGRTLVEERLAACANIIPGLRSIYRWQGAIEDDPELLIVIKTRAGLVDRLADRVKKLHPYELPEVVALPAVGGLGEYLDWVIDETETN